MRRTVIHATLLSVLWSTSVAAQSASSVFKDFGVLGRWTNGECLRAPSPVNQIETFAGLPSGAVEHRFDVGADRQPNVYLIRKATRLRDNQISFDARFNNKDQQLVLLVNGEKIRTISNLMADGTYRVKDGIAVLNGQPTSWRKRCT